MANWISRDEDLRKPAEAGEFSAKARKLFGIIKDVSRKLNRSKPATVFPACETIEVLKDCQMEFEQKKSEALAHLYQFAHMQKLGAI